MHYYECPIKTIFSIHACNFACCDLSMYNVHPISSVNNIGFSAIGPHSVVSKSSDSKRKPKQINEQQHSNKVESNFKLRIGVDIHFILANEVGYY